MDELWENDDGWFSDDDNDGKDNDDKNDENDNDNDNDNNEVSLQGATHVLVLVDSNTILTEDNDIMNNILRLLESTIRNKIRMITIHKIGKRDGFGLLLYNTKYRTPRKLYNNNLNDIDTENKQEKNEEENDDDDDDDEDWNEHISTTTIPTTVHEIISLAPPGIVTIKQIQGAMSDNITCDPKYELDLIPEYKNEENNNNTTTTTDTADADKCDNDDNDELITNTNSLQVVLHQAIQIFRNAKCVKVPAAASKGNNMTPIDKKQIWIISSTDTPCSSELIPMIQTTAHDAQESNIDIVIWPIDNILSNNNRRSCKTKQEQQQQEQNINTFDYTKFYDIIQAYTPLRDLETELGQEDNDDQPVTNIIKDIMISCMQQEYKKIRRTLCIPLLLPNWNVSSSEEEETISNNSINKSTTSIIPDMASSTSSDTPISYWPSKCGIMIDIYKLIQPGRKPPKVPIHIETGHVLSRIRQILSIGGSGGGTDVIAEYKNFGSPLSRKTSIAIAERRIRRYVTFGGEHVPMTKQDQLNVRTASNANKEFASLILLGFKSSIDIPFYHTLEQTYFIYPTADEIDNTSIKKQNNDEDKAAITTGGCDAFVHLRASMIRKNVVAIGELLTRVTATSRLVVLWPTGTRMQYNTNPDSVPSHDNNASSSSSDWNMRMDNNSYNINDDDTLPPGLAMATIPFEDEMRVQESDVAIQTYEETGTDIASSELVSAMTELIQKQTLTDVTIGDNFENASLLQFWDYIEQIALDETTTSTTSQQQDKYYDTIIDRKEIQKLIGTQIDKIKTLVPEDIVPIKSTGGRKRKIEPDDSGIDWQLLYSEDRISECKVPELKKKLKSLGEPVSGNKAELVARIVNALEMEKLQVAVVKTE